MLSAGSGIWSSEVYLEIIPRRSALVVDGGVVGGSGMAKDVLHVSSRLSASASISVGVGFRLKLLQGSRTSLLEPLDQIGAPALNRSLAEIIPF